MGDRISFSFTNRIDKAESVAFFSHCGGESLLESVNDFLSYLTDFLENSPKNISTPLSRLEPNTVMLDFIRWYFSDKESIHEPIESGYYLGKDENDGDNSDNGHHKFELADYIIDEKPKNHLEESEKKEPTHFYQSVIFDDIKTEEMYKLINELIYLPGGLFGFIKVKNENNAKTKRLLDELLILSINQKEVKK